MQNLYGIAFYLSSLSRLPVSKERQKGEAETSPLQLNCVDLVVHIVVFAIQAVLFISSLLEELNGYLTELCIGENVLLLLIILGDICLKVIDLIMDQIAGRQVIISSSPTIFFWNSGSMGHGVLPYLPATMSLNSLVTIL